ncbi:hypothetical protein JIG36_03395 [Actinoplanes sp. LDG1-06]|uniref:Uncharacterized protein n=1 Tax=Paractinoplanes ovalisporus TaxID=2810368 RepID=A0ABS2A436_9ACTN|nr:hypothetical protein [Actinoplanes ovalisporus]MBM2614598.1 hypothetical protein [Actinoplanes ovalisporus]
MSRTDKTRPWWVQMADAPMRACRPHHDHRFGPCTLPPEITRDTAGLGDRRDGCRWVGTQSYWYRRCESKGAREWAFWRRTENRRDRHQERRRLYTARRECGRLLDVSRGLGA